MIESVGHQIRELICNIGIALGYEVANEVEASASAWVDVVWFDDRLSPRNFNRRSGGLRRIPVLPVAGFEIEVKTGLQAKHIKGSVSNLNNLGALMGCIVLGAGNLETLRNQKPHIGKSEDELEKMLLDRAYRWIYAESQPSGRIVLMTEREILEWADRLGVTGGNVSLQSEDSQRASLDEQNDG